MNKKVMLAGGLLLFGMFFANAASTTITSAEKVISLMKFELKNIRNIRLSGGMLKLNVDVVCSNPSSYELSVNTVGLVQGKAYRVYLNDNLVSFGNMNNISGIHLPAGGQYLFDSITIEIPLMNIGIEIVSFIFENEDFINGNSSTPLQAKITEILNKIYFEVDVDAIGTVITFKSKLL